MRWCEGMSQVPRVGMVVEKGVIRNDRGLRRLTGRSAVTRGLKIVWIKIHDPLNVAGFAPRSKATVVTWHVALCSQLIINVMYTRLTTKTGIRSSKHSDSG
jgi:hypothetical protein